MPRRRGQAGRRDNRRPYQLRNRRRNAEVIPVPVPMDPQYQQRELSQLTGNLQMLTRLLDKTWGLKRPQLRVIIFYL